MLESLTLFGQTLMYTLRDVSPIIIILVLFQVVVLRRKPPNIGGIVTGSVMVLLGLAAIVPGRSPLIDGFGLIAFASVFPIISVLGYAIAADWLQRWRRRREHQEVEL